MYKPKSYNNIKPQREVEDLATILINENFAFKSVVILEFCDILIMRENLKFSLKGMVKYEEN